MLVFVEGGKPKKTLGARKRINNKLSPHVTKEIWESNPGYSGGRRALSTLVPKEVLVLSIENAIPSSVTAP